MDQVPQALAARDTRGMVKLVADRDTDRLLGAHIVAPLAGEMIQVTAFTFEKDIAKLSCCAG